MADKPLANPLPADLPENWQYNQIVAPSGAEVGLSAQHGYNYLMEQVNAVQAAVNAINDAFANLASLTDGKIPVDQLIIDAALSASSSNPVQNKAVAAALGDKVPNTRKVNNKALSADISLTAADVGALASNGKAVSAGTADTAGACSGNAATSTKLQTARSIHVNLGSTSGANFDGTGNISPGVQGVLGVGNGGTGANNAASARSNLGINLANLGGCRIVTGTYIGNGSERKGTTLNTLTGGQFINLGTRPKFVWVGRYGDANYANTYAASTCFAIPEIRSSIQAGNVKINSASGQAIDIVDNGFYVGNINLNATVNTNNNGETYAYMAII